MSKAIQKSFYGCCSARIHAKLLNSVQEAFPNYLSPLTRHLYSGNRTVNAHIHKEDICQVFDTNVLLYEFCDIAPIFSLGHFPTVQTKETSVPIGSVPSDRKQQPIDLQESNCFYEVGQQSTWKCSNSCEQIQNTSAFKIHAYKGIHIRKFFDQQASIMPITLKVDLRLIYTITDSQTRRNRAVNPRPPGGAGCQIRPPSVFPE